MVATTFVVVLPALAVWTIVPRGEAVLLALSVPLGMLLSVLAGSVGGALWKRVPGSRDIVFADLMLWGWLRRLRAERRLAHAETLLGNDAEGLSVEALTKLSALLEARDSYTYGHSQRVTRHAERIAEAMGLSAAEVAKVRTAAALHDVGKLHTPREILNKPRRLTEEEFETIRRHPVDGAAMATGLGDPTITAIIRHHHERLDGAGYPAGLAGDAIPLGARIIAVADTFDAMTSNRAYRRATSHKRALDVLRDEAGTQLDADAVAAFLGYYRGRRTIAWSAFATAAPQRLFAWLGGLSPSVGAGAAGAAAVLIGIGVPQPPVISQAAASPRTARAAANQAATGAERAAVGENSARAGRRSLRAGTVDRSAPRRSGSVTPQPRAGTPAPVAHKPAHTPAPTSTPSPQRSPDGQGSPPTRPARPTVPGTKPPPTVRPLPIPQVDLPELELPKLERPSVELPVIEIPGVELPEVQVPPLDLPGVRLA